MGLAGVRSAGRAGGGTPGGHRLRSLSLRLSGAPSLSSLGDVSLFPLRSSAAWRRLVSAVEGNLFHSASVDLSVPSS